MKFNTNLISLPMIYDGSGGEKNLRRFQEELQRCVLRSPWSGSTQDSQEQEKLLMLESSLGGTAASWFIVLQQGSNKVDTFEKGLHALSAEFCDASYDSILEYLLYQSQKRNESPLDYARRTHALSTQLEKFNGLLPMTSHEELRAIQHLTMHLRDSGYREFCMQKACNTFKDWFQTLKLHRRMLQLCQKSPSSTSISYSPDGFVDIDEEILTEQVQLSTKSTKVDMRFHAVTNLTILSTESHPPPVLVSHPVLAATLDRTSSPVDNGNIDEALPISDIALYHIMPYNLARHQWKFPHGFYRENRTQRSL